MSGGHLLVQLYRRLIRDLDGAIGAIERSEVENAHVQLVHAQDIVDSLDQALDHDAWSQAGELGRIYGHVRNELVRANMTKDAAIVVDCRRILQPLAETWEEALALTSSPVADGVGARAGVPS